MIMTDKRDLIEDAEDEGLKAVMGGKFQDKTKDTSHVTGAMRMTREMEQKYPSHLGTVGDKKRAVPEGEWKTVPTYAPNWFDKLKGCGKYAMVCGLLVALFGYWHISGQMDASAAVPCMVACGTIGGFKIGNVCRR
jgi:hypothetical protein